MTSQNFHPECEVFVNRIVNMELHASYAYFSMTYCFSHHRMALKHFTKFFQEQSRKKKEQAEKLVQYLIKRGRHSVLEDILKPDEADLLDGLHALETALLIEKTINQELLGLYKKAKEKGDPHFCGFLESEYLDEQVKTIKLLGDHITNLKRLGVPGSGIGEYLFDKYTLEDC